MEWMIPVSDRRGPGNDQPLWVNLCYRWAMSRFFIHWLAAGRSKIEIKLFHTHGHWGCSGHFGHDKNVLFAWSLWHSIGSRFGSDDSRLFEGWVHDGIYWPNHGSFIFIELWWTRDGWLIVTTSWTEGRISKVKVISPFFTQKSTVF